MAIDFLLLFMSLLLHIHATNVIVPISDFVILSYCFLSACYYISMRKISKRVLVTNAFGTIGYGLTIFSWLLFIGVLFLLLWQDSSFYTPVNQVVSGSQEASDPTMSTLAAGVGYAIAAVMAVISLGIIVVLPYFVGKLSSKGLKMAMKHLKVEASKRHLFLMKCCVAALPLLGFFVVSLLYGEVDLTIALVHIATVATGVLAMVLFLVQLLLARHLKVSFAQLW